MTVNQMRFSIKERYPNSEGWQKKVDKMPDEQVIAIYMNPRMVLRQTQKYTDTDLVRNQPIDNPIGYLMFELPEPDYRICPHCSARLDLDERCDCYAPH